MPEFQVTFQINLVIPPFKYYYFSVGFWVTQAFATFEAIVCNEKWVQWKSENNRLGQGEGRGTEGLQRVWPSRRKYHKIDIQFFRNVEEYQMDLRNEPLYATDSQDNTLRGSDRTYAYDQLWNL